MKTPQELFRTTFARLCRACPKSFELVGLALATLLAAFLAVGVTPAFAVHNDSHFELGPGASTDEGGLTNILGNSTDAGPDWADLFTASGSLKDSNGNGSPDAIEIFGGTAAVFIKDDLSAGSLTDKTVFTSTSDKNDDLPTTWVWGSSSVPAKDDISNAYAFAKVVGNHLLIYAGIEREDPSGDSHVDVEFNHNVVGLDRTPPCPKRTTCLWTGTRTAGDIIVSMDFLNGGGIGSVTIRHWNGTAFVLDETLNGEGCNGPDTICAFNNGGPINGGPWDNFNNHAAVITTLQQNAFTEFGVDVSAILNLTFAPCFATVQVKTRSSQSFTAELKDFAVQAFEQCTATVATQVHNPAHQDITNTLVNAGTAVHDQATVTGVTGFNFPTGTVTFKLFQTANCTGTAFGPGFTGSPEVVTLPGNATVQTVESTAFTPSPGALSYMAHYSGDSNYPPDDGACEPLTVTQLTSSVTTEVHNAAHGVITNTAVDFGTSVHDKAIVMGNGTDIPTGTVTFKLFANAICTGAFTSSAPVTLIPTPGTNTAKTAEAESGSFTTGAPAGFFCYQAQYNGSTLYQPSQSTVGEPICSFDFDPPLQ